MPNKAPILAKESAISIGLSLTLLSAAVASGAVWQRVDDMDKRLVRIETKVDELVARKLLTAER